MQGKDSAEQMIFSGLMTVFLLIVKLAFLLSLLSLNIGDILGLLPQLQTMVLSVPEVKAQRGIKQDGKLIADDVAIEAG